jgi:hypothetical protein
MSPLLWLYLPLYLLGAGVTSGTVLEYHRRSCKDEPLTAILCGLLWPLFWAVVLGMLAAKHLFYGKEQ